jgi:hypothetical protein
MWQGSYRKQTLISRLCYNNIITDYTETFHQNAYSSAVHIEQHISFCGSFFNQKKKNKQTNKTLEKHFGIVICLKGDSN